MLTIWISQHQRSCGDSRSEKKSTDAIIKKTKIMQAFSDDSLPYCGNIQKCKYFSISLTLNANLSVIRTKTAPTEKSDAEMIYW